MTRDVDYKFGRSVLGFAEIREESSPALTKTFSVPAILNVCTGGSVMSSVVGTTGFQGGDSGHGGRAVFGLVDHASTDWSIVVETYDGKKVCIDNPRAISMVVGGDSEISNLAEILSKAGTDLSWLNERQSEDNISYAREYSRNNK